MNNKLIQIFKLICMDEDTASDMQKHIVGIGGTAVVKDCMVLTEQHINDLPGIQCKFHAYTEGISDWDKSHYEANKLLC